MAYHSGVGADSLAARSPHILLIVLDIGHIGGYTQIKQMFEYMAILTACQMLSEYCHSGKILLIFYYNNRSGIVDERGHEL